MCIYDIAFGDCAKSSLSSLNPSTALHNCLEGLPYALREDEGWALSQDRVAVKTQEAQSSLGLVTRRAETAGPAGEVSSVSAWLRHGHPDVQPEITRGVCLGGCFSVNINI